MTTGWPLLLDDRLTAQMLTVTKPTLRRLVRNGHVPAPRSVGGLERWHRDELEGHLRRTWDLDAAERVAEKHAEAAKAALDNWTSPGRRRDAAGKGRRAG
jgi:excisionase family DNA binding protein